MDFDFGGNSFCGLLALELDDAFSSLKVIEAPARNSAAICDEPDRNIHDYADVLNDPGMETSIKAEHCWHRLHGEKLEISKQPSKMKK